MAEPQYLGMVQRRYCPCLGARKDVHQWFGVRPISYFWNSHMKIVLEYGTLAAFGICHIKIHHISFFWNMGYSTQKVGRQQQRQIKDTQQKRKRTQQQ